MKGTTVFAATVFAVLFASCSSGDNNNNENNNEDGNKAEKSIKYTVEDNTDIKIYSSGVQDTLHLLVISDTHLWMSDSREIAYQQYSSRMAAAYNETMHFRTGEKTTPEECLRNAAAYACEKGVDAICLLGDIVSYPSEYSIELTKEVLDATEIPWYYVCGNHDWHYEGMKGTEMELRDEWTEKRLTPLFGDRNPLMYSVDIKGVKLVFIDNSTYEIKSEQLKFFDEQDKLGKPMLLMMHIPMYAPGRGVGWGCGHPDWNASNDTSYKLERRKQWPEEGHTDTTFTFRDNVIASPNLLAAFSGHVHVFSVDEMGGSPFFTVSANYQGGYYDVKVMPSPQ